MPSLSLVIPTYKRPTILAECLERIDAQTVREHLEVIVVSDGPDPEAAAVVEKYHTEETLVKRGGHPVFKYLEIPKSHQGVARNRGVKIATAPIVFFIGDDILLEPDCCAKHLEAHALLNKKPYMGRETKNQKPITNNPPEAVLGFTTWDPRLEITPVMKYLERSGWQFGYPLIAQYKNDMVPSRMQHHFTYTSHISLPTAVAKAHLFREDVTLYGWEDMEWGLRLKEAGVSLFYEPDAKAYHKHAMTLEDSLQRMETLGRSAVQIEKISGLRVRPMGWKALAYRAISLFPTLRGQHAGAFLRGVRVGQQ